MKLKSIGGKIKATAKKANPFVSNPDHHLSIREYLKTVDRVWLLIWLFIYVSFLALDACFPGFFGVTVLKYTGILLCFFYGISNFPEDYRLVIALGLTLLADTALVVNNTSLFGIIMFAFAQFFHASRFSNAEPKFLGTYFVISAITMAYGFFHHFDPLIIAGAIYGGTLICNVLLAHQWFKHDRSSVFAKNAFIGFVLFICCDTCVAMSYFSLIGILPAVIYNLANFFAWFFYYPSQVFISNSSTYIFDHKKNKKTPKLLAKD